MTRWASAPDTPVPAAEVGAVLRHPDSGSDADDTGPCNEQEQLLIDQVRLVLHLPDDQITLRSNFFALGGDSMSALQLATALGTHGWQADIKDVFLSPDLRSLAATLVPGPTGRPEVTPLTASGLDQKILDRLLDEDKA
ncbi:phosphopantetheine-binding protein [Arachnia propionica]|uniref:phosphopantetheine-binding protein n=1 Tax=Arachnia propionica TaxID=1750 RepID=UPI0030D5AE96